jgi:hypothetical protein
MSKQVLRYQIHEAGTNSNKSNVIEIITDRDSEWTMNQYLRNRDGVSMKLLSQVPFTGSEDALLFNNRSFMYKNYG